jgi:hypothetical protein
MTNEQINDLGKALAIRRLKTALWQRLRIERPTLARDTIMRAFTSPNSDHVLFAWIYKEGLKVIEEDNCRIERDKAVTATFHNTEAHH